ncbi:hypothetical protein DOE76_00465 [Leifsonia sp. ku-ls]|nr:hypothetical protein DOE76_00465 [Leifsonia sp. ku-ls]
METGSAEAAVLRAVRHPSTATAVRRLGGSLPLTAFALWVSVDQGAFVLSGRSGRPFLAVPASDVRSIGVGEVRSRPPMPVTALAVIVTVNRPEGEVLLPIVPVGDDGRRVLTWRDAEVRSSADRLRRALALR